MSSRLRFEREMEDLGIHPSLVTEFQMGQPSSDCSKCPASPATAKKLNLTCHFHVQRYLDPKTDKLVAGSTMLMEPKNMRPYYIDAWMDEVNVDRSANGLQTKLENVITSSYTDHLKRGRRAGEKASVEDKIRIALVDLTKDKLDKPEFAGWGSTIPIEGASVPKIVVLYALHQLAFDLQYKATTEMITRRKDLVKTMNECWTRSRLAVKPKIEELFAFTEAPPDAVTVNFSTTLKQRIENMIRRNMKCAASRLILQLGFNYIGSVVFQSGLRHPTRGGLWLRRGYCCTSLTEFRLWRETTNEGIEKCTIDSQEGRTLFWKNNPMNEPGTVFGHNATALSVALFYTLLAQKRLVDETASDTMMTSLSSGCSLGNGFWTGLTELGGVTKHASKCGIVANHLHESFLVERDGRRYVAVVLSKHPPKLPFKQLLKDLDQIIKDKNP